MHNAKARVRCGDEWHEVGLRDGRLQFPAHPRGMKALDRAATLMEFGDRLGGCARVLLGWRQQRPELLPAGLAGLIDADRSAGKDVCRAARRRGGRFAARRRRSHRGLAELLALADGAATYGEACGHFLEALCTDLWLRGVRCVVRSDPAGATSLADVGGVEGLNVSAGDHRHRVCVGFTVSVPEGAEKAGYVFRLVKRNSKAAGNVKTLCEEMADLLESAYVRHLMRRREEAAARDRRERVRSSLGGWIGLLEEFGVETGGRASYEEPGSSLTYRVPVPGGSATLHSDAALKLALPLLRTFAGKMNRLAEASRRLAEARRRKERDDDEKKES